MTPIRSACIAFALLAIAGCAAGGGGTAPPGSQAAAGSAAGAAGAAASGQASLPAGVDRDACSLLTDAEILDVTGQSVTGKEPGDPYGVFGDGCNWTLDQGSEIGLGVTTTGGRAYFDKSFKPYATEEVSGVGDAAIREDAWILMAVKGDLLVQVQFVSGPPGDIPQRLVEAIFSKVP